MGMLDEFKDFAMKGNVVDLAVGVVKALNAMKKPAPALAAAPTPPSEVYLREIRDALVKR